jgi:hypothetical protein
VKKALQIQIDWSVNLDDDGFARVEGSNTNKKAAPVSSSGKKPAQPYRCETMQQVLAG